MSGCNMLNRALLTNSCAKIVLGKSVKRLSSVNNNLPELTRVRYPDVHRGNYAQLEKTDVAKFTSILDESRVITDETDLEGNCVTFIE